MLAIKTGTPNLLKILGIFPNIHRLSNKIFQAKSFKMQKPVLPNMADIAVILGVTETKGDANQ